MATWEASWSPEDGVFADSYNVHLRPVGGTWSFLGSTAGLQYEITTPSDSGAHELGIAIVIDGIEADEDGWEILTFTPSSLDDIAIPPDVVSLAVQQLDQSFSLRARFPPVVDPHLDVYEIREGADWENGLFRKSVPAGKPGVVLEADFGLHASGDSIYWVKAVSIHGQYSVVAASAALTAINPAKYVTEASVDEKGAGFLGTKTDMEVNAGNLRVSLAPATMDAWTDTMDSYTWPFGWPHHGVGSYETPAVEADDGAGTGIVVDEVIEIDQIAARSAPRVMVMNDWTGIIRPEFSDSAQTFANDPGTPGPFSRITMDETLRDGVALSIEIDTTPDDPAVSPTWDGWREFIPGAQYRYRGVRLRFTFDAYWWDTWVMSKLTWTRKRLNLKDEGEAVTTGIGPETFSFATPFTKIPKVVVQIHAGGTAVRTEISNVTRTAFDVDALTAASGSVATTLDWHALGV